MAHNEAAAGLQTPGRDPFAEISKDLRACMQCGTCTGSCGSASKMDHTPRQVWRMVQEGLKEELFNSRTFWLCSSCYYCTLRCPRGLPLTDTMAALKRIAAAQGYITDRRSPLFYKVFLDTVQKYGRVRETELMARYFLGIKNPAVSLSFVPLGMKLMAKGKMKWQIPAFGDRGKLDGLYRKVKELEEAQ